MSKVSMGKAPCLLILFVGWILSAVAATTVWNLEVRQAQAKIEVDARALAESVQGVFQERTRSLMRMAKRWKVDSGSAEGAWRADALNIQRDTPGQLGLARVSREGVFEWVEPIAGNEAVVGLHMDADPIRGPAFRRLRAIDAPTVYAAVNLAAGGRGFAIAVPLHGASGVFDGAIVAAYRVPDAFEAFLPDDAYRQVRLEFSANGNPLPSFGARPDELHDNLSAKSSFELGGQPWGLTVRGSKQYLDENHTSMSLLVFATGAIVSALLSYLVRQNVLARNSQIRLSQVTQALSRRQEMIDLVAGVSETDASGAITYVNEEFVRQTGYQSDEVLGQSHSLFKSGHHPQEFFAHMWGTISVGKIWTGEIQNRTKSGERRWLHTTILPALGTVGEITGYTSIRFDVTDRVLADTRLRSAIDVMESGFALFDREDKLVLCNDGFWDTDTRARFPNPIGRTFREIMQAFSGNPLTATHAIGKRNDWLEWRLRQHQCPPDQPLEIQWTNGQWMRVTERITPEGDTVGLWTDITEQKQKELSLQFAHEQMEEQAHKLTELAEDIDFARDAAERANKEKSQFLASMSHELRTPLNAILGFSEIIQNEIFGKIEPTRYREYGIHINESGQHLLSLINDLLDLSKVEAGRMDLDIETVATDSIVAQVSALVTGLAKSRKVQFIAKPVTDCATIEADERALKQILVNLISNAVKFTPENGIVELAVDGANERQVVITVRDTGIGMSADECVKALEPYGQVPSELAKSHAGTGLGLPLARLLTELHGGALTISSVKGQGTEVTIRLPRSPVGDALVVSAAS